MPRALLSLLLPLLIAIAPALAQPLDGAAKAPAAPSQCPDNMDAFADSDEVLTCTCPAEQMGQGSVWGTDTYTADSATCRAAQHAGLLGRRGGTVTVEMQPGQPRYPGTTRNGVQSQNYGSYRASYRFQGTPQQAEEGRSQAAAAQPATLSQCPDNMMAYANSSEIITCTCPAAQVGRGSVWGTDTYAADSATCRAALHAGILGRQGGTVTLEMLPGAARYPGTTRNGVQSQNYGAYGASYRFQGVAGPAPAQADATPAKPAGAPAQCPDNMTAFADSAEVVTCICPAAQLGRGSVWGTDTYTADSATCRAALHAGMVARQGGTVTLEMLPGAARYPGTTRNGVQSQNYGSYGASYRFQGAARQQAAAAPSTSQLCPDNMSSYADSDEAVTCLCPGEATLRGSVWGTDTYTADSATCRAAVHAGMIAQTGGSVSMQMLPGAPRYPGTTRNGVQSQNYGAYNASFRFTGDPRAAKAAAPVQAPVAETLQPTGQVQLYITFRTNSADLDIAAAPVLTQLRDALAADPALRLRLTGHTDATGTAAINIPLSQRRAESVRQWLAANGIAAERLTAEGRGPNEPIADNASESGRSLNRRVQAARL
ncbi:LCCL domain-containing protein [Belnapia sp. F-4-1]|uniref:LCCL domain-containing protein n=1 Tax=Belnapia sp. F-4-1 TaxID=1545443 RepID=UPI00068F17CC|nr:LCCL domain-containing protein [Belnapia sp. F-4-1]